MRKILTSWKYLVVIVVSVGVAGAVLFYALSYNKTSAQQPDDSAVLADSTTSATLAALTNTPSEDATKKYIYANATDAEKQAAAQRGAIAFRNWCDSCHPHGQVGYGPALWGNQVVMTPAQVFQRIRLGDDRERMRFSQLSQNELNDIIAYIQEQERVANS